MPDTPTEIAEQLPKSADLRSSAKYYVVVHPSATFLMEIIGNRVTKAPDLANWAMNRNIRGVKQWYKTHGCQCYEVEMP